MDQKKIVEWLLAILRAEDSLAMLSALWRRLNECPSESRVKEAIHKSGEAGISNLFFRKRTLVGAILEVLKEDQPDSWAKQVQAMDLSQFAEGLQRAQTEMDVQRVLSLAPDDFQAEMLLFWKKAEISLEDAGVFRNNSLREAKRIIWRATSGAVKEGLGRGDSFSRWLNKVPLLPCELALSLSDNFEALKRAHAEASEAARASLEDQLESWNDASSFRRHFQRVIEKWLYTVK